MATIEDVAIADSSSSGSSWQHGIFNAEELQGQTFPPLKWVVPNIIPAEGASLICSPPKFGKSWFVLDLCLGSTSDRFILNSVKPMQGDVLYLALEDSRRRLQRRITKLLPTFGSKWTKRLTLKTEWRRLHEGGLGDINAWHDETKKAGGKPIMVVIDVLAKVRKSTGNRQLYEADYEALAGLTKLANELSICILVVHHVRKMVADDLMETVSGSFGTTGAVDTILVMAKKSGGAVLDIRGRDVESAELAIQFNKATCRWTILGAAADVHVSEQRAKIIAALKDADAPMYVSALKEATGLGGNSLELLLSRMAKDGAIKRVAKGTYARADYGPPPDKPPRRKPPNLSHLSAGETGQSPEQNTENTENFEAACLLVSPVREITDEGRKPHLLKPGQVGQVDRSGSQRIETTKEFRTNGPVSGQTGETGRTDPYADLDIPAYLRRCDHCGQLGTPADPLNSCDWPGRPDGIRLHGRCEPEFYDDDHQPALRPLGDSMTTSGP